MSIKINFDAARNPEEPTIVLAKRNGDRIGKLNAKSIEVVDSLNDVSEMSFVIYKYIDGKKDDLWDKVVNFKLVYCVEWNQWFEITVEIDESNETQKTVSCTSLGQAELGQIVLYDIEINTETDIAREDYNIPTVMYNPNHPEASLLHRLMEKAPHYSVKHVDATVANIQRTFTFDGTSIYDAFQDIAEEINCLFVFDAYTDNNGKLRREISVYDLESNCSECGYRGEFTGACPECSGTNVYYGYGEDTTIFVTADELADSLQLSYDTDEIKNCFKLKAGDDLMTAAIKSCNPNGSDYIWYLSDAMKEDMSNELVSKIEEYDAVYSGYQSNDIELDSNLLYKYNELVEKYKVYNEDLESITVPVKGFSSLINAYYNTFDLYLYLKSGLMPTVDTATPSIDDEVAKLTSANISPVAVNIASGSTVDPLRAASVSTADSLVLSMAKTLIDPRYKVRIADGSTLSAYVTGATKRTWKGKIAVSSYSDEDVVRTTDVISVDVNNDYETFVRRKIEKTLVDTDEEDVSISGLFKKELDDFKAALKQYSLNRLMSFHDACQSCIDVMIENGVADGKTWGTGSNDDANLYKNLYTPYYNKLAAIENEISIRDSEIAIIVGVRGEDGDLDTVGLQNAIEDKKNSIQNELDFEKYLGNELWLEFCSFRREDQYSNDNYISDGLNNAELIDKANEFIDVAKKEIYKSAELQRSISADLKNLLVVERFAPLVKYFKVGNWIRVMVDDELYRLRLISYTIDYDSLENVSVEFSDVVSESSSVKSVRDVIEQASSMATSYSSVQRQARQGEQSNSILSSWFESGLDATNAKIIGGADGQSQMWDNHGMLFREYNASLGGYSPEQMKIVNSTIAITDDNWKTTKTAVGKYYYFDKGEIKMGYGVNAETIIGKLFLGEQLKLNNADGSMSFDNNGFVVENNSNMVVIDPDDDTPVFSIKNKKTGDNVFSIGSDGNLIITGKISASDITFLQSVSENNKNITGVSDVALTGSYDDLKDKPALKAVATSGSYNDLTNKPALKTVATSGSYEDLTSKPSLSAVATSGSYEDLTSKPNLKTVATSGNYNDLTNKPALKTVATSGNYIDLIGNAEDAGKLLYVDTNGSVTTLSINDLKTKLGLS